MSGNAWTSKHGRLVKGTMAAFDKLPNYARPIVAKAGANLSAESVARLLRKSGWSRSSDRALILAFTVKRQAYRAAKADLHPDHPCIERLRQEVLQMPLPEGVNVLDHAE